MRAALIPENVVVELASFDEYLSIVVIQIEDEALVPDTIAFRNVCHILYRFGLEVEVVELSTFQLNLVRKGNLSLVLRFFWDQLDKSILPVFIQLLELVVFLQQLYRIRIHEICTNLSEIAIVVRRVLVGYERSTNIDLVKLGIFDLNSCPILSYVQD